MSGIIEVGDVQIPLASIVAMEPTISSRNVITTIKVVTTGGVSHEFKGLEVRKFVYNFAQVLGITVAEARAQLSRK